MKNALFPALIVVAIAGTAFAMSRAPDASSEEEAAVKLASASMTPAIAPWIQAAARDLGHTRVRAYDNSVFIDVGDDRISFFNDKGNLTMHVDLESRYRHAKADRDPALKALELKGKTIFEHALSMQARASVDAQVAQAARTAPVGG
jgi:hypothetical protein